MTKPNAAGKLAAEVHWSDPITDYDNRHEQPHLRLLDGAEKGVSNYPNAGRD